jgi:hypothetical protein
MKKLGLIVVAVILILAIAIFLVYSNLSSLTRNIVEKQIPNLTFSELKVSWDQIQLTGVKYSAPNGKVLLKTDSILVKPSLKSALTDTLQIAAVVIDKPYVFIQRKQDGEIVLPVPQPASAGQKQEAAPQQPAAEGLAKGIHVGEIRIENGSGEFVDRSVGRPPAHFKIRNVDLAIKDIEYPLKSRRIPLDLSMQIEGKREGRLNVSGWANPQAQSGDIKMKVKDLFIPHAEPYYRSKDTTARLADGLLGLNLHVKMNQGNVVLPGDVTMSDIRFQGRQGKFFGVPVGAVADFFEDNNKPITIPFEVEGHIDRPEEIRYRVISVIVEKMIAKLGAQEVEKVTDKLKQGDVEGAKEEVEKLKKKFNLKGLKF